MSSANILVVDDEPQIRRVMRTTLTSQGYTITEAHSGEEALEILRSERPDLILLDVNMPGMGGLTACREIREHSDVPSSSLPSAMRKKTRCRRSTQERTTM